MRESGTVVKTDSKLATVRIERHSACGKCGMCGMSDKNKHIDFNIVNSLQAKVGDKVEIEVHDVNSFKIAAIVYVIPLAIALLGFLVTFLCKLPDWAMIIGFVVGLVIGFAIVALIDKHKRHKWLDTPEMVSIIRPTDGNKSE